MFWKRQTCFFFTGEVDVDVIVSFGSVKIFARSGWVLRFSFSKVGINKNNHIVDIRIHVEVMSDLEFLRFLLSSWCVGVFYVSIFLVLWKAFFVFHQYTHSQSSKWKKSNMSSKESSSSLLIIECIGIFWKAINSTHFFNRKIHVKWTSTNKNPNYISTRWWFQIFFIFTSTWGRWTHFDEHIFQMGWNHQLVVGKLYHPMNPIGIRIHF